MFKPPRRAGSGSNCFSMQEHGSHPVKAGMNGETCFSIVFNVHGRDTILQVSKRWC